MGTKVWARAVWLTAGLSFAASPAHAQVVLDGTLGTAGALSGPAYAIGPGFGQQLGGNLFHSFSQFSLSAGQSATFSGPGGVQNVISRVTGSASTIDGMLRSTISNANLFFINPRGITFGPNAQLDVMGSFHVSTADYLKLGASGRFDARNPAATVLSVAEPSAFGFVTTSPAAIAINGSSLYVPEGKSLSFTAGAIGISNAFVSARAGQLTLATTAAAGEIALGGGAGSTASLGGTISIANSSLDTDTGLAALPSGSIHIRGGKLFASQSYVTSYNYGAAAGGGIDVALAGELTLDGALVQTRALSQGRAGDISVQAQRVSLSNGGEISTSSYADGRSGDLSLSASESVTVMGRDKNGTRSGLFTTTVGRGDAGTVTVNAPSFTLDDAIVFSSTSSLGNAGAVSLSVGRLSLVNGGQINASSLGLGGGLGGDLRVTASESVSIIGHTSDFKYLSGLISTTGGGAGGSIYVTTPVLLLDGGIIATGTGSIFDAPAGNINVRAGSATFLNGGRLDATTFLTGRGGAIDLSVGGTLSISGRRNEAITESILREFVRNTTVIVDDAAFKILRPDFGDFASSGLFSRSIFVGPGGSINASAGEILIGDGGKINASSSGLGNAGPISLNAGKRLTMQDGASITTEAAQADGGNISIFASERVYLYNSQITTSVGTGRGNGGNISIDPQFVVLNNSRIVANAFGGNGGNINIVAGNFIASPDSVVDASSQLGISGSITITAPKADVAGGVGVLTASFFDASALLRSNCGARAGRMASSFTGTGRGGLPAAPGGLAYSDDLAGEVGKTAFSFQSRAELMQLADSGPFQARLNFACSN